MINLIKADLYRLRRSKTLKRCFISMMVFAVLMTGYVYDGIGTLGIISTHKYGYYFSAMGVHESYGSLLESLLGFTAILNICMIFLICDIVIGKYAEGMMRVPINHGYNRFKIYLSSLITVWIGVIGLGLFTILLAGVTWGAFFTKEKTLSLQEVSQIIEVMKAWICIIAAEISIGVLIATIFREKVIVAGFGVLYEAFLTMVMCMALDEQVLRMIPSTMMLELCKNPIQNTHLNEYIVYSTVILILTTIGGYLIASKQDIK